MIFGKYDDLDDSYTYSTKIKIRVNRDTARAVYIDWTDIPARYFPNETSIAYLELSDSPKSEFEVVTTLTKDSAPFYYDDQTVLSYFRSPIIYYRLRFPDVHKVTEPFSTEKPPNQYGAEISRRHAILLKNGHAGNLMYLFIKRKVKEQCPYCFDTIRGQRSAANCEHCLNTGFLGGYYDPIKIYISWSPETVSVKQEHEGAVIPSNMQGWTTGYPRISMGDVLVDPATRNIWAVQTVGLTTHKRVPTKQEIAVVYLEDDLYIYKLLNSVPRGVKDGYHRPGEHAY